MCKTAIETNNLTEPTQSTATSNDLEGVKVSYRRSKWRPAGTIQVYDDVLERYVGIEGVKVRARRWFTTHTGIANSDGEYSCNGRFRRDANYSIDWERYHFALQDGWLNGATYNGPKKRGDWDLNLNSGAQQYYATIFRAAYHYYYKDIKGLRRPPQNSFWRTQLKIRAYLENGSEDGNLGTHTSGWRAFGLYSPVKIYTYTRPSIDTYSTVIHELAHASHWNMDRSDFGDTETIVIESWARGVEWGLTKTVYSGYQPIYARLNYTGTVQDMIDGFGSKGTLYWWDYEEEDWGSPNLFNSYYDQISGYTLREIEDAIEGQKTWSSWKNNIINKFENDTEDSLGNGFNFWNTK